MNKIVKRILIAVVILGAIGYGGYQYLIYKTKTHSPEQTVEYNLGGYDIEVFYNRPLKKGRVIFGGLVSYGRVWRTGANEATTFETATDLSIDGQTLKAGKYTLWTIPDKDSWTVIFNNKQYPWGINGSGVSREAEHDALQVVVPVVNLDIEMEQFTIEIAEDIGTPQLRLMWDKTAIQVPMQ